jgi:hypothetical protein
MFTSTSEYAVHSESALSDRLVRLTTALAVVAPVGIERTLDGRGPTRLPAL